MNTAAEHWADICAEKIIREKGDKELYVCASGITPSGTVHIGNFREIISVELVVRALLDRGKKVRFIYSWDDYDVFRKVPLNMPRQEMLQGYLRQPITLTPDPFGEQESYARHNEREIERLLPLVGIFPQYIYQARAYQDSRYAEQMKKALENREEIRSILNEHRTSPLDPDWWPISIFCASCHRDTTRIGCWDGKYGVAYRCSSCGHEETLDLRHSPAVKLFWRVDWPMRWSYERVDFEPAGKDHHSEGGSFDTAAKIVQRVYGFWAPTSFQYDFIGIKGRGGKISSSSGEVISLKEVLAVYQPEVVRFMFASTRPNTEFSISFDLDVLKIYEDYDRCERVYYGVEVVSEKKAARERRIYELSQVKGVRERLPFQVPFRHLCNLLQIHDGRTEKVLEYLKLEACAAEGEYLSARARCAWNWVSQHAPAEFRFSLRPAGSHPLPVSEPERRALAALREEVEKNLEHHSEQSLAEAIYAIAQGAGLEARDFFKLVYRVLIGQEMGPRLAGFLPVVGRDRLLELLAGY